MPDYVFKDRDGGVYDISSEKELTEEQIEKINLELNPARASDYFKGAVSAVSDFGYSMLQTAHEVGNFIGDKVSEAVHGETAPDIENPWDDFKDVSRELYEGEVPAHVKDRLSYKVTKGAAQLAPMLALGAANKGLSAVSLASQGFSGGREDFFNTLGINPETATQDELEAGRAVGAMTAIPTVLLEKIGLGKISSGVTKKLATGVAAPAIRRTVGMAGTEAVTEAGEQLAANIIAKDIAQFDPQRKRTEGVGESALVGGIVGGIPGGVRYSPHIAGEVATGVVDVAAKTYDTANKIAKADATKKLIDATATGAVKAGETATELGNRMAGALMDKGVDITPIIEGGKLVKNKVQEGFDAAKVEIPQIAKKGYESWLTSDAKKIVDRAIRPMNDAVTEINPRIGKLLSDFEFEYRKLVHDFEGKVDLPMKTFNEMKSKDKASYQELKLALLRGEFDAAEKIVTKWGGPNAWQDIGATLREVYDRSASQGSGIGHIEKYFPRFVTDYKGLAKEFGVELPETQWRKALNEAEEAKGEPLTEDETSVVFEDLIRAKRHTGVEPKSPRSTKTRKIAGQDITPEMAKYYADPFEALGFYLSQMSRNIMVQQYTGAMFDVTKINQQEEVYSADEVDYALQRWRPVGQPEVEAEVEAEQVSRYEMPVPKPEVPVQKPAKKPSKLSVGVPADGNPDILNFIEDEGGLKTKAAWKAEQKAKGQAELRLGEGGEYDGMEAATKYGRARLLRKRTGLPPDIMMQALEQHGYKFETVDQMYEAMTAAEQTRKDIAKKVKEYEHEGKIYDAALENKGRSQSQRTDHPIQLSELQVGDKFKFKGEVFEYKGIDPDTGEAILQDGVRMKIDPDTPLYVDGGKVEAAPFEGEYEDPFGMGGASAIDYVARAAAENKSFDATVLEQHDIRLPIGYKIKGGIAEPNTSKAKAGKKKAELEARLRRETERKLEAAKEGAKDLKPLPESEVEAEPEVDTEAPVQVPQAIYIPKLTKSGRGRPKKTRKLGAFGQAIQEEIAAGRLTDEQVDQLHDHLGARFQHKAPMSNFIRGAKTLTQLALLGSPTTSIRQLGDYAYSMHKFGMKEVMKAAKKSDFTLADVLIESNNVSWEFTDSDQIPGRLQNTLDRVMSITGMRAMDSKAKATFLTAQMNRWQRILTGKDTSTKTKLIQEFQERLGVEQAGKVIEDVKARRHSDNVAEALLYELTQIAPIAQSDMPYYYNKYPNVRILYTLKSYTLKQFNFARNQALSKIMSGDREQVKEGFRNLLSLSAALGLANIPADILQAFITGKDLEMGLDDLTIDNLWRLLGLNSYTQTIIERDGIGSAVENLTIGLPMVKIVDDVWHDITHFAPPMLSTRSKSTNYVPIVGKILKGWQDRWSE